MSAHATVRKATAPLHAVVDELFSRFDLTDVNSYGRFLKAHAYALVPIEVALGPAQNLPSWDRRYPQLSEDLRRVGSVWVGPYPGLPPLGPGELFGLLYLLEGSRLGTRVLASRVGDGLPTAFLSAHGRAGSWRDLLTTLELHATRERQNWIEDVVLGASLGFNLFAAGARAMLHPPEGKVIGAMTSGAMGCSRVWVS